jgi:DNA-binding HxlR family transcriptional regulator
MSTADATRRRRQAAEAYLAELAECPGHQVLALLGGRWTTLVVEALADGPVRHGALERRLAGVARKVLTETLRRLRRDGLVERRSVLAAPVSVDYRLTPLGRRFLALQREVLVWAERHADEVAAARAVWDAAAGGDGGTPPERSGAQDDPPVQATRLEQAVGVGGPREGQDLGHAGRQPAEIRDPAQTRQRTAVGRHLVDHDARAADRGR